MGEDSSLEALRPKDKIPEPAQFFLLLQRPQENNSTTIQLSVTRFVYLYAFASLLFIFKCIYKTMPTLFSKHVFFLVRRHCVKQIKI